VQVLLLKDEAIAFIEWTPYSVFFEYFDAQWAFERKGMIDQFFSIPFADERRIRIFRPALEIARSIG